MQKLNTNQKTIEFSASRQFISWLDEKNISLVFTTYQAGKVFFIGLQQGSEVSVFERTFNRCMGLSASPQTIYMSSSYQIWRFENVLEPGESYQGYDRVYVPQVGYTTGDVDTHDVCVDKNGEPVFVNTLFSCLARPSEQYSFVPVWKPSFISKLAAEDRCHLNGLAMQDGEPKYVTCISSTDVHEGWREHRNDGGVVVDVATDEIICNGLSMPHSPRIYKGKLWLLNSGAGEFGYIDIEAGRFEPVTFCPGYLRGLSFIDDYAIVGLSRPRENKIFAGLDLDGRLKEKNISARSAIQIIDLKRGDVVHELRIEGLIEELYDVCALPGVKRPMAIGFMTDEISHMISIKPENKFNGMF